eukprot:scaffold27467_cov48-Phaeocystis_antarctica.AAC.1
MSRIRFLSDEATLTCLTLTAERPHLGRSLTTYARQAVSVLRQSARRAVVRLACCVQRAPDDDPAATG